MRLNTAKNFITNCVSSVLIIKMACYMLFLGMLFDVILLFQGFIAVPFIEMRKIYSLFPNAFLSHATRVDFFSSK